MTVYEQDFCGLRLEWDRAGVRALGPRCAVLIIVDVLVFTTTVDIALGRGGRVLPLPWRDERAEAAARAAGAVLTRSGLAGIDGRPVGGPAGSVRPDGGGTDSTAKADHASRGADGSRYTMVVADRASGEWTLRPSSLVEVPEGTFLAISSLNGATLCAAAAETGATVLAGCLRNASAVAAAAVELAGDEPIGIVPAGERWRDVPGRPLRPGIEEMLGAGAIAAAIMKLRVGAADRDAEVGTGGRHEAGVSGRASAEAELAAIAYRAVGGRVAQLIANSVSGRELIAAGVSADVRLASDVDVSSVVPLLVDGVFEDRR